MAWPLVACQGAQDTWAFLQPSVSTSAKPGVWLRAINVSRAKGTPRALDPSSCLTACHEQVVSGPSERKQGERKGGRRGLLEGDPHAQQWGAAVPVQGGSDKSNLAGVEGSSSRGEEDKRKDRVGAWPSANAACFPPSLWSPGPRAGPQGSCTVHPQPGWGLALGQRGLLSA